MDAITDEEILCAAVQRLQHLKTLFSSDLITQEDFELRKSQIVDELTGTSSIYQSSHKISQNFSQNVNNYISPSHSTSQIIDKDIKTGHPPIETPVVNALPTDNHKSHIIKRIKIQVIKHEPPDWTNIRVEKAEKWIYDYDNEKWLIEKCKVKIDEVPFDKGGLRYVFHLQDITGDQSLRWVAKMSQEVRDNVKREIYFNDVRMQAIARHFCNGPCGYNSYNPPKKVDFLDAFVLHLQQREGSPVCHVERYIPGKYIKYNNNVGWVSSHLRNTPQAFAHFTYEASRHKLLVCDIQGVNDVYTDPQVHTIQNQKSFGRGNLGKRGFENFLRTHRCNILCAYLTLPNINQLPIQDMGTVPAQKKIEQGFISTVAFDFEKSGRVALLSDKGFPKIVEEDEFIQKKKMNNLVVLNTNMNHDEYLSVGGAVDVQSDDAQGQGCCCIVL